MTTAPAIGTTACSAKQATIRPCWRMLPSGLRRREDPSIRVPASAAAPAGSHRFRLPLRHARQLPQDGTKQNATWSPGESPLTSRSDRRDHSGALMAEHHRPAAAAQVAVGQVHVGVTHARGRDADQHLAAPRRLEQHRLDAHRHARLAEHHGAHGQRVAHRRPRPASAAVVAAGRLARPFEALTPQSSHHRPG